LQTVRNRMSRLLQRFHLENRTQLALHMERLNRMSSGSSLALSNGSLK
jgi:DNA-binding NarL/FixJ family response regulator